jgi:hypothetical protein
MASAGFIAHERIGAKQFGEVQKIDHAPGVFQREV